MYTVSIYHFGTGTFGEMSVLTESQEFSNLAEAKRYLMELADYYGLDASDVVTPLRDIQAKSLTACRHRQNRDCFSYINRG